MAFPSLRPGIQVVQVKGAILHFAGLHPRSAGFTTEMSPIPSYSASGFLHFLNLKLGQQEDAYVNSAMHDLQSIWTTGRQINQVGKVK
jgi:hypothetical protein